jgi:hypothetical protein
MRCWHFWRERHFVYDDEGGEHQHCQPCCDAQIDRDGEAAIAAFWQAAEEES